MFDFNLETVTIPHHNMVGYVISKDEHGCRVICDFCSEREIRVFYVPNEEITHTTDVPCKPFDTMVYLLLMSMKESMSEEAFYSIPFINERRDLLSVWHISGNDLEKLCYDFISDEEFQSTITKDLEESKGK